MNGRLDRGKLWSPEQAGNVVPTNANLGGTATAAR